MTTLQRLMISVRLSVSNLILPKLTTIAAIVKMLVGQKGEAKADFKKAKELDPKYTKIISYLPVKVNYDRMAARQLTQRGDTQ